MHHVTHGRWIVRSLCAAGMLLCGVLLGADQTATQPVARPTTQPFVFRDVGEQAGLFPAAAGIRGHAAAWGDADGDGFPDLFIGTFHDAGSKPSMYLRNIGGKFRPDQSPALNLSGCGSGGLFVDLTNSGRLDLYISNNANRPDGERATPSALFRNDGPGRFTDVSKDSGACPPGFQGRSVAAADFDGDGLLDLLACDFYYGTRAAKGIALYHNLGNHRFDDIAEAAGLPRGSAISGAAIADLNSDGWPDIVLVGAGGDNRALLNDGHGKFREAPGTREVLSWKNLASSDSPTGICIADINRDGLPDIVIGHHFKAPWREPASIRLYLHRGMKDGAPVFEEVTQAAGLKPLAMKAPHVEIQDFDNDGWPDIYTSIVKFKDGQPYPIIYRNLSAAGGGIKFHSDAWEVNDFPSPDDLRGGKRSGAIFEKANETGRITYMAAGPSGDFNRDGRLDLFLATWFTESRSLLLKNETPDGHWLDVQVEGKNGVNRMGVGSRIRVYPAGKLGDPATLLGDREIAIGYGWCSGQEAIAHFGLGGQTAVDIEVILPCGKGKRIQNNVKADQRWTIKP